VRRSTGREEEEGRSLEVKRLKVSLPASEVRMMLTFRIKDSDR